MTIEDYDQVYALWNSIHGFGLRSLDDSREAIDIFLKRNPTTSAVDVEDGKIVGAILCGHDGRRACFYHVCVSEQYRMHGIGKKMVNFCCMQLKKEKINKVCLNAFVTNEVGNKFWKKMNWTLRDDMNYYDFVLNDENKTVFVP
jgi:ribosomal protein S18 acetylase RimI-like enzyme